MCSYQGYEFGANYLDSVCVDGFLWDADSGNGEMLDSGGDLPCPQCNHSAWRDYHAEAVHDDAYFAIDEGRWPFRRRPRFSRDKWWMLWHQIIGVLLWLKDYCRR